MIAQELAVFFAPASSLVGGLLSIFSDSVKDRFRLEALDVRSLKRTGDLCSQAEKLPRALRLWTFLRLVFCIGLV